MTGHEKVAKMVELVKSGRTLFISSHTRTTKVTPRTLASWEKAGHQLFKSDEKSMYMASGNKFVCIDYCSISFQ